MVFIASTISSVQPSVTTSPTRTNGAERELRPLG